MRRTATIVALLAVTVAACSDSRGADSPTTFPPGTVLETIPPSAPTSTTSAPPTTPPEVSVRLSLHPYERLATRNGPTVTVTIEDEVVGRLSDATPTIDVALTDTVDLGLAFMAATGEPTDVAWTQRVTLDHPEIDIVQPWRDPSDDPEWHVLAWSRPTDRDEAVLHVTGAGTLSVISPLWWFVGDDGSLGGSANADDDFVDFMHANDVAVWPAIQGLDADGLHALLADDDRRTMAAQSIAEDARVTGADGLNIDIEGFRREDADGMSQFVEEVAEAVHEWGGVVSYDIVPRSDTWEITPPELAYWSDAPERRRIAAAVDYTILMAYDQHNGLRPVGPVAAPSWVEEVIIYQLRYADPEDVMLGIPAYGRLWDPDELDGPRALSLAGLPGDDGDRSPDPEFDVDRVDRGDGLFYWAEVDVQAERMQLAVDYGLSGVAVWRLGLDYPRLWEDVPQP